MKYKGYLQTRQMTPLSYVIEKWMQFVQMSTYFASCIKERYCGNIPQFYERPFLLPLATGQSDQSQASFLRPITGQFIPTSYRPVYSYQSNTIHQPTGPNKRKPHGPVEFSSVPSSLRSSCLLGSVNQIAVNKCCCHWSTVVVHQATLRYPTYSYMWIHSMDTGIVKKNK
jgi:hypothetical protein